MLFFLGIVLSRLGGRYFYAQVGLAASLMFLSIPENDSLTGSSSLPPLAQ